MTLSVIEMEVTEGEVTSPEFFRDPDVEMIIRKFTDTGLVVHATKGDLSDRYGIHFCPKAFEYQIRYGSTWIIETWYEGKYTKCATFVPENDNPITLEQMNQNRLAFLPKRQED